MLSPFILPHIARLAGYVPGEQPQGGGFIKLNTNENPYPPSPRVKSALLEALNDRLRLYPDPMSTAFCQAVAQLHGVAPEMVMAGNGSDDLLTILTFGASMLVAIAVAFSLTRRLMRGLSQLKEGAESIDRKSVV